MAGRDGWVTGISVAAGLLAAATGLAQPAGDPATGGRIAAAWCSNCHLIGPPAAPLAQDAAPPFAAIAQRPGMTQAALRAFLQAPHASMPDYNLTPRQQEDVTAYLLGVAAAEAQRSRSK